MSAVVIGTSQIGLDVAAAALERQSVRLDASVFLLEPGADEVRAAIDGLESKYVFVCHDDVAFRSGYELEREMLDRELGNREDSGVLQPTTTLLSKVWRKDEIPGGMELLFAVPHDIRPPAVEADGGIEPPSIPSYLRGILAGAACAIGPLDCRDWSGTLFWLIHKCAAAYPAPESLRFLCRCLHEADYVHHREFLSDYHWNAIRPRLDEIHNLAYETVEFPAISAPPRRALDADSAPALSVVVPVFNCGRFLPRCLESLRRQTRGDIEIICVDDGSTDDSPGIVDRYAAMDGRVVAIHKPNTGVSDTRNTGIARARGRYVAFVDGDDWMEPDFAEKTVAEAEARRLDVCYFDIAAFAQADRKPFALRWSFANQRRFFPRGTVFRPCDLKTLNLYSSSCCAIYDRKFLLSTGCRFPDAKLGEDSLFVYSLLPHVERAFVIDHAFYRYRRGNPFSALGRLTSVKGGGDVLEEQRRTAMSTVGLFAASDSVSLRRRMFADILYFAENYPLASQWLREEGFAIMGAESLTPDECGSALYHKRLHAQMEKPAEAVKPAEPLPFYGRIPDEASAKFRKIEKARENSEHDTYIVMGQLNSKENEPIDSWTMFEWLQKNGIPSKYVVWKEHWLYARLESEGRTKDVIALDGDGFSDYEFLDRCFDAMVRARAILQENALLNYAVRDWAMKTPGIAHVFLQHGVFFTGMTAKTAVWLGKTFNFVNVASRRERDFIHSYIPPSGSGHGEREFCICGGLPRWDKLQDRSGEIAGESVVFVMLTWRSSFDKGADRLVKSAYYNRLRELLSDGNVAHWRSLGLRIVLAPHHHMANAIKDLDFGVPVEIADTSSVSYWIRHAKMLVTDFSSVSIDFHFQRKPCVYWILDHDDFLLDPRDVNDGGKTLNAVDNLKSLCNVASSMREVVEMVDGYARNGFVLEPEKRKIADSFFKYRTDICRHVYEAVEEALEKTGGIPEGSVE